MLYTPCACGNRCDANGVIGQKGSDKFTLGVGYLILIGYFFKIYEPILYLLIPTGVYLKYIAVYSKKKEQYYTIKFK
jgi:hypothetical protein